LPRGPIHGDLYPGNFLKTADGTIYLLDFDTFSEGIRLYDPALICNQTDFFKLDAANFEKTKAIFARFLSQYRQYMPLPELEADALYDVIALYHFALQATILEVFGLDCVDEAFLDRQLDWLRRWRTLY